MKEQWLRNQDVRFGLDVSAVKLCVLVFKRLLMRGRASLPQSIMATASAQRLQGETSEGEGRARAHTASPCRLKLDLAQYIYMH